VANIAHIPEGLNDPSNRREHLRAPFTSSVFAGLACTALAIAMLR